MNKRSQQVERKSGEIDRISELPDSLLIYILSLLDDMKDAVKTDLLSKRWKHLWTNLDTLLYNCDIVNTSDEQAKQFLLFVDYTISRNTCLKIKKLSVTGCWLDEHVSNCEAQPIVDKWVDFLIEKNVQHVKLGLRGLDYEIPVRFFHNSSFETLEIDEVGKQMYWRSSLTFFQNLVPDENFLRKKTIGVCWRMLKSLLLKYLFVKDDFIAEILLGCPVLETMVLDAVEGMTNLNITSPSVKELKVLNVPYDIITSNGDLNITAPSIEKLEVSGYFESGICRLGSMHSLNSATITPSYSFFYSNLFLDDDMDEDEYPDIARKTINRLLQPVCGVDELVVGVELLHALSMSKLSDGEPLTYNCKSVTLQSPICMHQVPGMVSLLESSRYLETLVIKVIPWQCYFCRYPFECYGKYVESVFSSFSDTDYLSEQKGKFVCIKNVKIVFSSFSDTDYLGEEIGKSVYIKNVKIDYSKNKCFDLKVIAHIIKNAPALEKLVILSSRPGGPDFATRYIQLMSSKNEVGDKAARWDLKKRKSSYEFCFSS